MFMFHVSVLEVTKYAETNINMKRQQYNKVNCKFSYGITFGHVRIIWVIENGISAGEFVDLFPLHLQASQCIILGELIFCLFEGNREGIDQVTRGGSSCGDGVAYAHARYLVQTRASIPVSWANVVPRKTQLIHISNWVNTSSAYFVITRHERSSYC
jgi:hypothetical protein